MSRFFQDHPAGGFRLASPVKVPVASETPRCAPPHTKWVGEEPEEGGSGRRPFRRLSVVVVFIAIVRLNIAEVDPFIMVQNFDFDDIKFRPGITTDRDHK